MLLRAETEAHAAVVNQIFFLRNLHTAPGGPAAVDEMYENSLGRFLENNPDFWGNPHFRAFILSVADDIANEAADLAYIRHRDPVDVFSRPPAQPDDIHDAARAVMIRRRSECRIFFEGAEVIGAETIFGSICNAYITEGAVGELLRL